MRESICLRPDDQILLLEDSISMLQETKRNLEQARESWLKGERLAAIAREYESKTMLVTVLGALESLQLDWSIPCR